MNRVIVVIGVMSLFSGGRSEAAVFYGLTDLGVFDSQFNQSQARAINAYGQIAGRSVAWEGGYHDRAFFWEDGKLTNLGLLPDHTDSLAGGLNDLGMVVGRSSTGDPYSDRRSRAFLWHAGHMTELDVFPGMTSASASAINNAGQIVGLNTNADESVWRAFVWEAGELTDLGAMPSGSTKLLPTGINDSGVVVGWGDEYGARAFVWQNGNIALLPGLTDGGIEYAFGINSSGTVVGSSYDKDGNAYAVKWTNGDISGPLWTDHTLGPSGSAAVAINDIGAIIGHNSFGDAILYVDGVTTHLQSRIVGAEGWTLDRVQDINNNGQIVGYGTTPDGYMHGFLLTPISYAPIPEPTSLLIWSAIALGGLGLAYRRRKRAA